MVALESKKRDRLSNLDQEDDDDQEMEFGDDDMNMEMEMGTMKKTPGESEDSSNANVAENKHLNLVKPKSYKNHFSPELLSQYYSRLFPYTLLTTWLSYNPSWYTSPSSSSTSSSTLSTPKTSNKLFTHREYSFTIEPSPGDEIYIRYQSFKSPKDLQTAVMRRQPRKIDIGAIFSHPPKDHNTIQNNSNSGTGNNGNNRTFHPEQRELVFDIDLTDYDPVRQHGCGCSEAKICNICWKAMNMAIKVMDAGLREDFGFEHICWFYSGRRGVHCWVCDESARILSDAGRSAVANYFEVNLGTDKNPNVEIYNPLHPMLKRAYSILEPMFIRDVITPSPHGHNLLGNPLDKVEKEGSAGGSDDSHASTTSWGHHLLSTLPGCASAVSQSLSKKWEKDGDDTTPAEKWEELNRYLNILIGKTSSSSKKTKQAKNMSASDKSKVELWPIKTVFKYTYPRLDINVSKMQNHLLKSPFCVHPKTGRVCIPIDVRKVDDFDPFSVPTLPQLMDELDAFEEQNRSEGDGSDGNDNGNGSDSGNDNENENEDPNADADGSNGKGGERSRKKRVLFEWEKTSLKESFMYFQKDFLDPMMRDLKKQERVKAEKLAAMTGDF